MQISRTRRFFSFIINMIASILIIGLIINLILIFTAQTTIGGLVMGYKHEFSAPVVGQLIYWLMLIITGFLSGITFGIFWIIDVVKMDDNNGSFAEKWSSSKKVTK